MAKTQNRTMHSTDDPTGVEEWLDSLDPATTQARDATAFRNIIAAAEKVDEAERGLVAAVKAARDAGDSWTVIGAALGVTRQAAFQRFNQAI